MLKAVVEHDRPSQPSSAAAAAPSMRRAAVSTGPAKLFASITGSSPTSSGPTCGPVAARHDGHAARRTAVAARQDAGAHAARRQRARQPERHRRLAGAADREVADADHRDRRAARAQHAGAVAEPAQPDAEAEEAAQRTQGEIAEPAGRRRGAATRVSRTRSPRLIRSRRATAPASPRCARARRCASRATARARAPGRVGGRAIAPAVHPSSSASSLGVRTTAPPPAAHSAAAASATFSVCGPKATGLPYDRRLEHVVAAERRDRAADEDHPGGRQEAHQLAERVEHQHLHVRCHTARSSAERRRDGRPAAATQLAPPRRSAPAGAAR